MPETEPTRTVRRAAPKPFGKRLSGVAAIIAASLLLWLIWSLISGPGKFGTDPLPGYLGCAAFAVLATASSVTAAIASGRRVPPVLVVAALATWGLLPLTVSLTVWLLLLGTVFALLPAIFLAAPLVLAGTAQRLIRYGRVARGTGILLAGLLYTVGATALWAAVLPLATWLPVILWHLILAGAAVGALVRDIRLGRA